MKFTLEWLAEHISLYEDVTLQKICHTLTQQGLEVEELQDNAASLKDFVIAEVIKCEPHPDADKLKLCQVFDGKNQHQVVCGAPNAKLGMKGVFAPVGTYIMGADFTLKNTKIRGVESQGMLCSERELQISDEHDGIIALGDDAPVGENFAKFAGLDDVVIDIAVTPNRGDCLGVRGIARDLAAAGLGVLQPLKMTEKPAPKITIESPIKWQIDLADNVNQHCPYVAGRYFTGLNNQGKIPAWMHRRLKAIGVKLISPLVDVTNYITFDLGRPLHVFDGDKISGDLLMRKAKQGEKLTALDGNDYQCSPDMTVISDDKAVVSLAGIMGGLDTGCSVTTQNMFLEAALFDAVNIAETGRQLNIHSDARFRFERKIDPDMLLSGLEYASMLICEICGGQMSEIVSTGTLPNTQRQIDFELTRLSNFGGVEIETDEVIRILSALGFEIMSHENQILTLKIPSFRPDITTQSCIVEEVLRIYGYDNIPVVSLPNRQAVAGNILTLTQKRVNYIKRALCARGLFEAYSWSFCDSEKAKHFWCESAKPQNLYLQNPISEKLNIMRPTPLVTLLEAMGENHARKIFDMKLFEIGPAFDDAFDGQRLMASLLRSGANNSKDWQHNHVASNLFDIKTDMMAVIEAIGFDAQKFKITNDAPDYYHPGQSGSVMLGKNIIAHFGTLHPLVARDFTLKKTVSMGEIFIDNLPIPKSSKGKAKIKLQASAYQPVMRDFAFVLDENISAGELIASIKKAEPKYLSDVGIFDLYQDDSLGQGKKSLAVNVVLQPLQESFTDELLEEISVNIIDAAQKIGAKLRE